MRPRTDRCESIRRLGADTRGAAMTEYLLLIGAVGILAVAAFVAAGATIVASYGRVRDTLAAPFP